MSLDECRKCGVRVKDFERDGYEGESGQRGHFTCEGDSPDVWVVIDGMGGFVCGGTDCGESVESEPCPRHQAFKRRLWGLDAGTDHGPLDEARWMVEASAEGKDLIERLMRDSRRNRAVK